MITKNLLDHITGINVFEIYCQLDFTFIADFWDFFLILNDRSKREIIYTELKTLE